MAVRPSRKKQSYILLLKNNITEMNILQKERALFLSSQGKKNQLFLHIINHLLVRGDKTEPVSTSWQIRVWLLCFKLC